MTGLVVEQHSSSPAAGGRRRAVLRRILHNPAGVIALSFLGIVVLVAIIGPFIVPQDPDHASALDALGPISGAHLLGADSAGRDVLSRLLVATRFSIAGAALAVVLAAILGVGGGLIAGYYGRFFDGVASWVVNLLQAIPAMVVLLAARAVLGPSLWSSMAIFGVLLSPAFFRLVYAAVTAVKGELYVDAARVTGLSDARIIGRHILSVVRAPVLVQAAIVAGIAISIQAGLDFLGLGDLALVTWGGMLSEGFANIYTDPILMLWPSLAIALSCMSLVLVANAARDAIEGTQPNAPRARRSVLAPVPVEATGQSALLEVHELRVGYDQADGSMTTVIDGVSLAVHRGEVHGLVGESGSGKTQTAWSVMGLLPDGGRVLAGTVVMDGVDLVSAPASRLGRIVGRRIGYVPQEPMSNLDPSFTIGSQLTEPLRVVMRMSRRAARARALELLARVGIQDPKRTFALYPHEISGGMAQRVLIAGAVSCSPDLLIADEPTTALDVTVQAEVLDLLRGLRDELGMGVLLVTHNFGVVADICDTVSVMRAGRVVESGPVQQIFDAPRDPYTRSLLDAILEEVG